METPQAVQAAGLSTQRHLEALYSASSIFTRETIHKAILTTGVALEYALHETESTTDTLPVGSEDRVVLITGFKQHKEEWAPVIRLLLDKYKSGGQMSKMLKIVSLDNRGMHGSDIPLGRYTTSSMAQDVLALMSHLGWESAHIVGVRYASATVSVHSSLTQY